MLGCHGRLGEGGRGLQRATVTAALVRPAPSAGSTAQRTRAIDPQGHHHRIWMWARLTRDPAASSRTPCFSLHSSFIPSFHAYLCWSFSFLGLFFLFFERATRGTWDYVGVPVKCSLVMDSAAPPKSRPVWIRYRAAIRTQYTTSHEFRALSPGSAKTVSCGAEPPPANVGKLGKKRKEKHHEGWVPCWSLSVAAGSRISIQNSALVASKPDGSPGSAHLPSSCISPRPLPRGRRAARYVERSGQRGRFIIVLQPCHRWCWPRLPAWGRVTPEHLETL